MSEKIRIYLEDWQFNAGIMGFYNILEYSKEEIVIKNQYIEFELKSLENFAEKYLSYFIGKYYKNTPWYRIISYNSIIESHENNNFKNFNVKSLDNLNEHIKMLKEYLKKDNYKKIYPFIKSDVDILGLEKEIKTITLRKKDKLEDKIVEVKELYKIIKEIINYCNSESGKKYIAAKGVIYNFINNGWNDVCFLNRNTKEYDVYKDYQKYFVDTAINYIKLDKENFKHNCFICKHKIEKTDHGIGFLNKIGFDVTKKPSHVWKFNNDVAICDLCRLIYSCLPAGFTYGYNNGIFINSNANVDSLLRINSTIRDNILNKDEGDTRSLTYRALVNTINAEHTSNIQYELQDVQIIRWEDGRYKFNILSKDILLVIKESCKEINSLINTGYKESRNYFNVYDMMMERLLDNYNMFTLIHKLLIYKITESETITTYYHMRHIMNLNIININYLEGVKGVNKAKENRELIKNFWSYGHHLRKAYINNDRDADKSKIRGISYRLLNALKTRNSEMFMHNIITSYLYLGKTIPYQLTVALEDEEKLGIAGYAFITGLNGWGKEENENGGEIDEN